MARSTTFGFPGLDEGELTITLTSVETVTAGGAAGTGVFAAVSITGVILGTPVDVDATCPRALSSSPGRPRGRAR